MSAKDNTSLVRRIYQAINARQSDSGWFDTFASSIAEDFVGTNPRGVTRTGPEGLEAHYAQWIIAFPDCKVEVTNVFATRDQALVEFIGRGLHTGTLQSPSGDISPTDRKAELRFCEVFRFREGKIVTIHTYYDALDLLRQLGVIH